MATPRDASSIFEAIRYFYENPDKRQEMGENAYHLAKSNFDPATNAARVMDIYHSLN